MEIKKITDRIELNVEAQRSCKKDCKVYKAYKAGAEFVGCYYEWTAHWCPWW